MEDEMMLEVAGKVIKVEAGFAWIIREGGKTCPNCDPQMGCRALAISRLFCKNNPTFRVRDPLGVAQGDQVSIGIKEKALLMGAIAGYGVPLFTLILGAIIGLLLGKEFWSILGGALGFILAMLWLKCPACHKDKGPVILRRY
jgi:sigma-E factor negative regulatory protein RseC